MENPKKDPFFSITNDIPIVKNIGDGSWFINNSQTRLNIITPHGYTQWKNIEMTGYVKAVPIVNQTATPLFNNNVNNDNIEESKSIVDISWQARGGSHNSKTPCEGTAYHGGIYLDGTIAWKKEIWHTGGYTDARGTSKDYKYCF